MTAPSLFSRDRSLVKAHLVESFSNAIEPMLDAAWSSELSAREAECRTWAVVLEVARLVLTAVFAAMCRRASEDALASLNKTLGDVTMRMEEDYWPTLVTTFGRVSFPWFAFRRGSKTQVPARSLFPLRRRCCSSELLLEWETALAADHPFRKAAAALGFFTHGAVELGDNTIERHAVLVGSQIAAEWQYQTPEKIREILRDLATRDSETGLPLVYASTDAHAMRRYVDLTWRSKWKMVNGIRLWCINKKTGKTIHLGGEYISGDCHEVRRRFAELQASGHLPADGDYGDGVVAQVVIPTDGQDWIAQHVLPLFPDAISPLDPYHVIEQVTDAARVAHPKSKKKVRQLVRQARRALGIRDRRGRTVFRKGPRRRRHRTRHTPFTGSGRQLLDLLCPIARTLTDAALERFQTLLGYITRNFHRLAYGDLRNRGICVGSGAMESQHRFGSQLRTKLAGCRWTEEVAQAILNARMLTHSGRWDEFWAQPDLPAQLAAAGGAP